MARNYTGRNHYHHYYHHQLSDPQYGAGWGGDDGRSPADPSANVLERLESTEGPRIVEEAEKASATAVAFNLR